MKILSNTSGEMKYIEINELLQELIMLASLMPLVRLVAHHQIRNAQILYFWSSR